MVWGWWLPGELGVNPVLWSSSSISGGTSVYDRNSSGVQYNKTPFLIKGAEGGTDIKMEYSHLSLRRTPLEPKATVRFREVSALERVNVNLIPKSPNWDQSSSCSVQWSHDGPVVSLLAILTEPNTAHTNFKRLWISLRSVINLCKHPVSVLRGFSDQNSEKSVCCPP